MARSDDPKLEARLRAFVDRLKPVLLEKLREEFGESPDVVFTLVLSSVGKVGSTAYLSTGKRDEMIGALSELVMNMWAERQGGPHEPTVIESMSMLVRAAIRVLEVSEEHVSEEEGMKRLSELAALVGYPPKKTRH